MAASIAPTVAARPTNSFIALLFPQAAVISGTVIATIADSSAAARETTRQISVTFISDSRHVH